MFFQIVTRFTPVSNIMMDRGIAWLPPSLCEASCGCGFMRWHFWNLRSFLPVFAPSAMKFYETTLLQPNEFSSRRGGSVTLPVFSRFTKTVVLWNRLRGWGFWIHHFHFGCDAISQTLSGSIVFLFSPNSNKKHIVLLNTVRYYCTEPCTL